MAFLIVLGIVSLVAIVGTIVAVRSDGYGPVRTDWSRLPDRSTGTVATADAAGRASAVASEATGAASDVATRDAGTAATPDAAGPASAVAPEATGSASAVASASVAGTASVTGTASAVPPLSAGAASAPAPVTAR